MSVLQYESIVALQRRRETYHELLEARPEFSWLWRLRLRAIQLHLEPRSNRTGVQEQADSRRRRQSAGDWPYRQADARNRGLRNRGMIQDAEDEPTEQQPKAIRSRVALRSLLNGIQQKNDESRSMSDDE